MTCIAPGCPITEGLVGWKGYFSNTGGMLCRTHAAWPEEEIKAAIERFEAAQAARPPSPWSADECGCCEVIAGRENLEQAPVLQGGQSVQPWCVGCLEAYRRGLDDSRFLD
jgi:hypothetical protein